MPDSSNSGNTTFLKDSAELQAAALAPAQPTETGHSWPVSRRALAALRNRLGGLMEAVGAQTQIDPKTALALWAVESSGYPQTPGRAAIRFECSLFYDSWGRENESIYGQHFRHGGHNGQPGKSWQGQEFREDPAAEFAPVHANQDSEYRALELATQLGGEEAALGSASIGGPQIVISGYPMIGYASCRAMYDAFQQGERAQVLGFFDFCRHKHAPHAGDLLQYLRDQRWTDFAHYYNGPGNAEKYGSLLKNYFTEAAAL